MQFFALETGNEMPNEKYFFILSPQMLDLLDSFYICFVLVSFNFFAIILSAYYKEINNNNNNSNNDDDDDDNNNNNNNNKH